MELHEFVEKLRARAKKRRAELMDSYNRGLTRKEYIKTVGRIAENTLMTDDITSILKTSGEDSNEQD